MIKEEYNYWLANINRIGIKKTGLLLQVFQSAEAVFHASDKDLDTFLEDCAQAEIRFTASDLEVLKNSRLPDKIQKEYENLKKNRILFLTKEDEGYPEKLKNIYEAPFALYIRGRLPREGEKLLAVVGARECSAYGKEMAQYLAGAIAKEGVAVISGLARGIDSFAHEGALSASGITYGVLGCGIDICYPRENLNLYMEMQKEGGILSEYAPGTKPLSGNFPMRNRIISGLSDAILVIEAREKSGSLITVDMGLDQGKDIYALPGKATDALSAGCNNLIKMGAKLVTSPKDILEDLIPDYRQQEAGDGRNNIGLTSQEEKVYSCLSSDPKHIEEIAMLSLLPVDLLMEQLLLLELRGLVRQSVKNYYYKTISYHY